MVDNPILKKDIKVSRRLFDRPVSDREVLDLLTSPSGDLVTVSDLANLAQAIVNRLLTRKGELAKLGHPDYGSRLHTLIGELNNTRTCSLADLYIRECLKQEPRIQAITQLTFLPSRSGDQESLQVTIAVKPAGQADNLTVNLSLNLGG